MLSETKFFHNNIELFKSKALAWAYTFETACYFDSNNYTDQYSAFDVLIAAGVKTDISSSTGNAFDCLQNFINQNNDWVLGCLSYDLKNEIENLKSENPDQLYFPELYFFNPLHLILIKGIEVTVISPFPAKVNEQISIQNIHTGSKGFKGEIQSRIDRETYIKIVNRLKEHILRGDVYEINFCQEFFSENADIDALLVFNELNNLSPTPFATLFKLNNRYIISATPERFLSKRDKKLISQPIKGTAPRSKDINEDESLKYSLMHDEKERAENVMIVDIVRNDLTRCAIPGTVRVEELFGIYSFEQVHQLISTVVCDIDPGYSLADVIKSAFPMGSMTGAPKVRAMQLIEKYELTKRGMFSGAVGYFAPNGDFDFNVVIRSLLYNAENKYLSYQVGSAITFNSEPEKEYAECLLKAEAIRQVLS